MTYDPERITFFAKTDARGQNVPFGIKAKDRTRHVYVIGKTGMGKSTLLENMAVQDMQHGNGLAFIDPHGATAETLLNYVPEDRVDDVLYFAPFDTENPIAFNVMEDVGPEKRHLVAAGLMSVFKKIWVDAWSARMEYILQNTLLALLEYPESTLLGVNRMLSDKHYRKAVIDNITDPAVKSFWVDEFLNYNERYMQEAGDAIKNKIGQFTANPLIRNIIGQPHTSFDLRQMMDGKKILIANLSKGLIGESNANLLGSMLTTRVYLAAMSRADLSPQDMKQMPNFYFYVDEFQSFANATFADILSEARKYHLNLTIAHQYIEQMEEEVRNAVFGNVGTIISFRVGPFDAEILETIYAPQFYAVDICNLGFAQIYLTLMIDGIGSRPFSATTLPPIEMPSVSCRDMVVGHSRKNYTKPREAVDQVINEWMGTSLAPARPQNNGKGNNNGKPNNNAPNGKKKPNGNSSGKPPGGKPAPAKPDMADLRATLKEVAAETTPPKKTAATKAAPPAQSASAATPAAATSEKPAQAAPPAKPATPAAQPAAAEKPAAPKATTKDEPTSEKPAATIKPVSETPSTESANLDDLRNVLRTLAKKDDASNAKKGNAKPTPSDTKPARKQHKDSPAPAKAPAADQSATSKHRETGASLKDALAEVLAERQSKADSQPATPADKADKAPKTKSQPPAPAASEPLKAERKPPAAPTKPAESPADTPESPTKEAPATTDTPPAPASSAAEDTYRDQKSRDTVDSKQVERMLRLTGADNSPLKKRS